MLNILGISLICLSVILLLIYAYIKFVAFRIELKKKKIKSKDKGVRDYLKHFSDGERLEIIDETPRTIFVGDKFYLLQPLKYRQFTRLCILLGKTADLLAKKGVDFNDTENFASNVLEHVEDDFFKAVAIVLYFSKNQQEQNETTIYEGMKIEYDYLVENATLDEISRILEVIMIQNDIQRALKSFGNLNKKKLLV